MSVHVTLLFTYFNESGELAEREGLVGGWDEGLRMLPRLVPVVKILVRSRTKGEYTPLSQPRSVFVVCASGEVPVQVNSGEG